MGRVNRIGNHNGIGNSPQLSIYQTRYFKLVRSIEDQINKIENSNINSNVNNMTNDYPINKGYFGEEGSSTSRRVIKTNTPIETSDDFFTRISRGCILIKDIFNGKIAYLQDGTVITYRIITKTNKKGESPAVDINIKKTKFSPKIKMQKIHFERGIYD